MKGAGGWGEGGGDKSANLVFVWTPSAWLTILSCFTHHAVIVIRCDMSLIVFTLPLLTI